MEGAERAVITSRRLLACLLAIIAGLFAAPAFSLGAPTAHSYDAPAIARVVVRDVGAGEKAPIQVSDLGEGSASSPPLMRRASTTRSDPVVATNTVDDVLTFGSKAAARGGLPGDAGLAANRFFRDATSKSVDFQAQAVPGGGYRLQFFSPANNPGYGKLCGQEIDAAGNVIKEFKNTLGPAGLIETKWVHGGP